MGGVWVGEGGGGARAGGGGGGGGVGLGLALGGVTPPCYWGGGGQSQFFF